MYPRHIQLRPFLRYFAALMVLFWVGTMAACHIHCASGDCRRSASSPSSPSCHGPKTSENGHADSDGHDNSQESNCCPSIKTAFPIEKHVVSTALPSNLLYTSDVVPAITCPAAEPSVGPLRQTECRDWVFTPEVCLGPAFRSLAPPRFA
jgi:hypothetical protein